MKPKRYKKTNGILIQQQDAEHGSFVWDDKGNIKWEKGNNGKWILIPLKDGKDL